MQDIEYPDLLKHKLINKLRFPNDSTEYDFSIDDFGDTVYLDKIVQSALHKPSGNKMAVKTIPIPVRRNQVYDEDWSKKILNGIELFQEMSKSSNVVDFYGFGLYGENIYICMELMDSSLSDVIRLLHISHEDFPDEFFGYTTTFILESLIECKKLV